MENQLIFYGDNSAECSNKAIRWFHSIGGEPNGLSITFKVEKNGDRRKVVMVVRFPQTTEQLEWRLII
jgi:hypothetical protein